MSPTPIPPASVAVRSEPWPPHRRSIAHRQRRSVSQNGGVTQSKRHCLVAGAHETVPTFLAECTYSGALNAVVGAGIQQSEYVRLHTTTDLTPLKSVHP